MNCPNNLNESERIGEEINTSNSDSDNQSSEKNGIIPQDIVKILFQLNNYNENLVSSIKRAYPTEIKYHKNYINEYCCINSKWMKYFLDFYNYERINTLFKQNKIKSEEELYIGIKENEIPLKPGFNDSTTKSIKQENFEPKKNNILNYTFNVLKSGEIARYFDDFVLVDKNLYDELKKYDKNPIKLDYNKYEISENIIKICLVDNIFIYKVNENVLGIGIPEIPVNTGIPIFKIQFFIIINEKYDYINEEKTFDSDSEINEILRAKDLKKYLILDRKANFEKEDEFKRIDLKFNNNKIGFIYNINNFKIENYLGRNDSEEVRKEKLKEAFNRKNEILKQKERKQEKMFKETEDNKRKKMQKMYDEERFKIWSKNPIETIKKPIKLKLALKNDINSNIKNTRYKDMESENTNYENNYNAMSYDKRSAITSKSSDKKSKLPPIKNYRSQTFKSIWTNDYESINDKEKSSFMLTKPNNLFNSTNISKKSSKEIKINVNNLFISCDNFHKPFCILPKLSTSINSKCNEKEEDEKEEDEKEEEEEEDEKEEDEKEEDEKEEDKKDNKKVKKNKKKHKSSLLTKEQKKQLKKFKKKQKEIRKRKKKLEEEKKKMEDKKKMEFDKNFNKVIRRHNKILLRSEEFGKVLFRLKHPDINVY